MFMQADISKPNRIGPGWRIDGTVFYNSEPCISEEFSCISDKVIVDVAMIAGNIQYLVNNPVVIVSFL
jgi:hypothetical protein